MAAKGRTLQVAAAAGIAAGTGAAQLGLGYGLGVVVWPAVPTPDDSAWLGSLGWATWIAASSTVFGAVLAGRMRALAGEPLSGLWRVALSAAAAIGAMVTVVLIAVPAREAVRSDAYAPEAIAGGYALIGVVLGLLVAYWAVASRPVAANLIATAAYLWALAVAGIVVELTGGRESATYLTSWQFADLTDARYGTIFWPSALITLLAALIIGAIAVTPAVRRDHLAIGAAASGAVGPLLVAASFFVLAPRLTSAVGQLQSAYLIAPYAVIAGLAGSALVVAAGRRAADRRRERTHRPAPPAASGSAVVPQQPTDDGDEPTQLFPAIPPQPKQEKQEKPDEPTLQLKPQTEKPDLSKKEPAPPAKKAAPRKAAPARASAKAAPAKAQAAEPPRKSTVAGPPPAPTVAKINPPQG